MANETFSPPSFSPGRRWAIFFSVLISIATVLALVIMLNYLGARYYHRFTWSSQGTIKLSPQTLAILKSLTNQVKVVIYYDKNDTLYPSVSSLLEEYRQTNPRISLRTVDYVVDAAESMRVKDAFKLGNGEDKNLVLFECEGRKKIVLEPELGKYSYEQISNGAQPEYSKDLKGFDGEKYFSSALLTVINPKPADACYLEGHGEHNLNGEYQDDYQKFKNVLEANNIHVSGLNLAGTNEVPAGCKLLIIAGPRQAIPREQLDKIKHFLDEGGRLFVLFNFVTRTRNTGLESILANWNVKVGMNLIEDPPNQNGSALAITNFNHNQEIGAHLIGASLALVNPRSISVLSMTQQGPEAPRVDELAWTTSRNALSTPPDPTLAGEPIPLMAIVKKGSAKGVLTERGTTAIVVAGDSDFLSNQAIELADNRDFASFAVDWLLDQTQLLQIGPHPVSEYKLVMTRSQMTSVEWLFLGAMPGAILLFGGLVWFRRRH